MPTKTSRIALSLGLIAGSELSKRPLFFGSYPITPASDILHELSKHKNFDLTTFQAEDEIAAVCSALGASYGGHIGVTSSSGPGICLKTESINLAVMTELPLVIIDAQRGGPSTGLPTKTEQGDLMLALYGRNSDSPIPIVSASTPGDSFHCAIEAVRIALEFMTPVFYLTDLYLIMGSEPWRIPNPEDLPEIKHNLVAADAAPDEDGFNAYTRDEKLARRWAVPGTPGYEHRIGGIEKHHITGNVNYDPDNHQKMVDTRAAKVDGIANFIPEQEVHGDPEGDLLVLAWGSTMGAVRAAVDQCRAEGVKASHAHVRYLNPFPRNLEAVMKRFKKVLVPELNMGQLSALVKSRYLIEVESLTKMKGKPFLVSELKEKIRELSA